MGTLGMRAAMPRPLKALDPSEASLVLWHRDNPMRAEEYLANYRMLLAHGMERAHKVYLDTNVWVRLRETELGKGTSAEVQLLRRLRKHVQERRVICVSHLHSFLEVGRQSEASLRVTARLLQELTDGVALAPPEELHAWECRRFARDVLGCATPIELGPWTKVGLIHRTGPFRELLPPGADPLAGEATLKAVTDLLWNTTFAEVFEAFDWNTKERLSFDIDPDVIAELERIRRSNGERGLRNSAVRDATFAVYVERNLRSHFVQVLSDSGVLDVSNLDAVLFAANHRFAKRSLAGQLGLSSLFVDLYCLAATSNRPIESADYADWAHAGAALQQCDLFVTERHLAHQLASALHADTALGCVVVAGAEDALRALDSLLNTAQP